MTTKDLHFEICGEQNEIAVIRLTRHTKRNALNDGLILALRDVFLGSRHAPPEPVDMPRRTRLPASRKASLASVCAVSMQPRRQKTQASSSSGTLTRTN